MTPEADLLALMRRYWGYSTFRPLQERIVRSLLAGRDTCVVMPTGGGKSLCYQLPAVISGQTAVVISPLIALMQDQAAQLAQMGIPAAVLNSSLSDERAIQGDAAGAARARTGCSIFLRSGWLVATRWAGCSMSQWHFSRSMRHTASPSGDTNSVPNTGS